MLKAVKLTSEKIRREKQRARHDKVVLGHTAHYPLSTIHSIRKPNVSCRGNYDLVTMALNDLNEEECKS